MNIIDPRARLMELTTPLPEEKKEEVASRIEEISSILSNDRTGELKSDSSLMSRVWSFSNANKGGKVGMLRNTILLETICPIKSLTLAKQELNEDLWDTLAKHGVEELIITQDGEPIVYETRVLKQLLEKTPPVESLTERYTLKFEDGKELVETKANLLLCGEYIETMLSQGMRETETKVIDFSENEMYDAFNDLLQEVKTGEREMDDDVYEILTDLLQYSKWTGIPEGAFGPVQWKELFNLEVTDVPKVPKNILDKIEVLKAENKLDTHKLIWIPPSVSLNKMGELPLNANSEHKKGYRNIWPRIKTLYGDETLENSRWILMQTHVLPKSRRTGREEQIQMAKDVGEGYDAPTLLEAVILNFTTFAETGERLFSDSPWTYTVCSEEPIGGYKLVVGGFSPAGLSVLDYVCNDYVGVAPVLR